ncbi:MAG: MFS transporter [Polyangiaceae bacterium]
MANDSSSLRHSVRDGAAHAVMLGAGEAYLIPFAVMVGVQHFWIGILASAPLLLGGIAQIFTAGLLDRAKSRRSLAVVPAALQGVAYLPLAALALASPEQATLPLLALAALYHTAAGVVVPAWNSWIAELVPPQRRGEFFGRRNRVRTAVEFGSVFLAGGGLALARHLGAEGSGFAIVFVVAALARLLSAREIHSMHEPPYHPPATDQTFTFRAFLWRSPRGNFGRFTLYVAVFLGATHVASPFFTPFMLEDLGFGYVEFTLCSAAFIAAQAAMMQSWGRVGDRFGNRRILALTGLTLPVVPMLWLFASNVWFVIALQVIAGLLWSGFHLSVANFLFDAVTPQKRARCVAYYNATTSAGLFLGASCGGLLATLLPSNAGLAAWGLPLGSPLQLVFVASGVLRLLASLALIPLVREVREVESGNLGDVIIHIVGQSPLRGARLAVFGGTHPSETDKPPEVR